MIDWFASKIGMLVFVTVVLSVLMGFVAMEGGAFEFEQKARMSEDVARLIDAAGNGGSITYEPVVEKYVLVVNANEKSVSVDGITRQFLANAANTTVSNSPKLAIRNNNGVVYVSP
ncbi:MAG: hypothetical protein QXD77_00540 [Candidatus Aenigmatarchaeota archaeon]